MTSNHIPIRKRESDHLEDTTSRITHAAETFINKSKKIEIENIKFLKNGNNEAIDVQSQSFSQVTSDAPLQKYRKISSGEHKKIFPVIVESSKGKSPRCKNKKTYDYKTALRGVRNQLKNNQNIITDNALNINTIENVDCTSSLKNNMGEKKEHHSAEILLTESNYLQVTDSKKVIENGIKGLIYLQNLNLYHGKAKRINFEKSFHSPSLTDCEKHHTMDKKSSKDKFLQGSSVISTKPISSVSCSDGSPLKSVSKVITTSIPTLCASKSQPTAVSKQKRTVRKLPNVFSVASENEIDYCGQILCNLPNTSQKRDHPQPDSSFDKKTSKQSHIFTESCNVTKETVSPLKPAETQADIRFQTPNNMTETIREETARTLENSSITNSSHLSEHSVPFQILDNMSEDIKEESNETLENSSIMNSSHLSEPRLPFQIPSKIIKDIKEESTETLENENYGITITFHPPQLGLPFQIPDMSEDLNESTETLENSGITNSSHLSELCIHFPIPDNMNEDIKEGSTVTLENSGITNNSHLSEPCIPFQIPDKMSEDIKEENTETLENENYGITITSYPPQPGLPFQISDNVSEDIKESTETLENSGITNSSCLSDRCIHFPIPDTMNEDIKEGSTETLENDNFGITISSHSPQLGLPFQIPDNMSEDIKEESTETLENENSDIRISFRPPKTIKIDGTSPWVLQDNSWAAHILRNIELLYKDERHCDLILKFYGGEVLKVHRTILSACTILLSELDATQDMNELVVPADLTYASVEPVIKFIYSGRLEMQGSDSEINAIYSAAKTLNVPPLMNIMELYCPYLSPSHTKSLTSIGDSERLQKQISQKSNICSNLLASPQSSSLGSSCKSVTTKTTALTPLMANEHYNNTENFKDDCDTQIEGWQRQDNSRKDPQSTSLKSCIKSKEAARPTRFELEDDSETCSEIPTLCTTPSTSYALSPIPVTASSTHPSVYTSKSVYCSSLETLSYTPSFSQTFKHHVNAPDENVTKKQQCIKSQVSHGDQLAESGKSNLNVLNDSTNNDNITDDDENNQNRKNESKQETYDHIEKISSIYRQLEELDDILQDKNFKKENYNKKITSSCFKNEDIRKEEFSLTPNLPLPLKSILKKIKDKANLKKQAKHVTFQLNENNELLNEVATFSLSKEPAQSLVEVRKNKETSESFHNTPMELTVSMNKNMLMNLPLSDSEGIGSLNLQGTKSHGREGDASSNEGHTKNHLDDGDITSHAKLVSEFLKKYPHVVKDKKKIGIKILKKENEKDGGSKLKTKVQYVILSDADSQSKLAAKSYKVSSTKNSSSISHTVNTFKCPECNNRTFETYFMLKKHVSSEHKDKCSTILSHIENVPYACYTCLVNEPLEFPNYFYYKKHMKDIHSKTYIQLCKICGFHFGRKLELEYHQCTEHNQVSKSFCFPKCDLCDHVAINKHALLKHRLQHTKADNYTCSVCGVKFSSFGALQGHMQTKRCRTKPSVTYKCPHCPLTFGRSYSLKAHCRSTHKSPQTSAQSESGVKEKDCEALPSHNYE